MEYKAIESLGINYTNYEIANNGEVKSLKRGREKLLKIQTDKYGYNKIVLSGGSRKNKKTVPIHQLVWDAFGNQERTDDLVIDHINRIRDDNRIENLRLVSKRQNSLNNSIKKVGKVKYRGVYWHNRNEKFYSHITFNKKRHWLGMFNTEIEASNAYERFRKEHNI